MRDFRELLNDIKLLVRDESDSSNQIESLTEESQVIDYKEYRNLQGSIACILKS